MTQVHLLGANKSPEFMDAFEALLLHSEAEYKAKADTATPETAAGDFVIVDYSLKALAILYVECALAAD